MKFRTILIDPPWPETMVGKFANARHSRPDNLPYPSMSLDEIRALPVAELADESAHLWLWTTNRSLPDGFDLMKAWGFRYLAPIHWIKPSGFGAWFIHRSQTCLFGYRGKLDMKYEGRFSPNIIEANPGKHSTKPEASHELMEQVSHEPRLELFARKPRDGWTTLGDAIDGKDITEAMKDLAEETSATD